MTEISPNQKRFDTGFHAKSTAAEVADGHELQGKTIVITGGYSGIGLETTRTLANCGAKIIVPVRRPDAAKEALSDLSGYIETIAMDLSDFASVRKAAADLTDSADKIDILINNAGVMACPLKRINDTFEYQFATNHLGHFTLFEGLLPALRKADGARVVALSSTGHRISPIRFDDPHFEKEAYDKWVAYGQSKTANSLFAVELQRRYKDDGIEAFAVHPGGIITPLQRHLEREEMVALGWVNPDGSMPDAVKAMFKTPEQGASTTVFAALSSQLNGKGGVYLEDCGIADLATEKSPRFLNVREHAVNIEAAQRLWSLTESLFT